MWVGRWAFAATANACCAVRRCSQMPEDAHPKGLRVNFNYNTNLWASRNATLMAPALGPPAGLFGPEQDMSVWWSLRSNETGVGGRACPYLPANRLLRSRCK